MRRSLVLRMALCLVGYVLVLGGQMVSASEAHFTDAFLNDPATIALGKKLWMKRCTYCHGRAAYPGSAPKLRPGRYEPAFIYDRITNGFRGMPALKTEFSPEERRAIVAYVKSPEFRE